VTFCTGTAREIFVNRHGWPSDRRPCTVIENGFDEADFAVASRLPSRRDEGRFHLVHSGTLYPGPDRDPAALLEAVANLREQGRLPERFRLTLRATGFDDRYRPVIEQLRLGELVELAPPLPYHEALREILDADGLLLIQGFTSNPAIPAKAYEYLRAGRPILALVDARGETAALLRRVSVGTIAQADDRAGIERALDDLVRQPQHQPPRVLSELDSARFTRRQRVRDFAALLERVAVPGRPVST
jgi:glycosyltransferase involved in cell wall biosynthesis